LRVEGAKALVTGAGGFIGSHLVESLMEAGCRVRAFIHYNARNDWGNLEFLPQNLRQDIEIYAGDVTDPFSVRNAVKDTQLVFHLAALIGIPYSYVSPRSYVDTNVAGTLHVMQACLDEGVEKVIHTSTSETYGTAQYLPIDEQHPLVGQSPYSATKIAADKIAESFHLSFGLPVVTVRPFNTYGPRQSLRAIIPTIIIQALMGNEIRLGALDPKRDFNFVKDTVSGFIQAASSDRCVGEVVNIGSGKAVSVQELFDLIKSLMKKDLRLLPDNKRVRPEKSEVMALLCNFDKAKKNIGYEPKFTLEKGLMESIDFLREHLHLFKEENYTI